jgi:hypothetical protein
MPRFLCLDKLTPSSLMGEDESCVELATTEVKETSCKKSLTLYIRYERRLEDIRQSLGAPFANGQLAH